MDKTLYPEFDKSLKLYKKEAHELSQYMRDAYGVVYAPPDSNGLLKIPLTERWLRGEEYSFLLRHYKTYNKILGYTINEKC
jgi:hypothetical protein